MSAFDLSPETRRRLRSLSLSPRRVAPAALAGAHDSRARGGGLEFAQYRAYERGDDPRRIDWRLYARSDRLFVRDAERESPARIWIVVDASLSMAQTDLARTGWSRFDAAMRLSAGILDIAVRDGDAFGLALAASDGPRFSTVGAGPRHRGRVRAMLEATTPNGTPDWTRLQRELGPRLARDALVVFISDALDDAVPDGLARLAQAGRDLRLIQVLTRDERDFGLEGGFRFHDAESGLEVLGDARAMRQAFLTRFAAARAALSERLGAAGVRHAVHHLDEDPYPALQTVLGRSRAS